MLAPGISDPDPQKEMPPGSGWSDADPDPGGKKAQKMYRFINFYDFLMSFLMIKLKTCWCTFSSLVFTPASGFICTFLGSWIRIPNIDYHILYM